MCIRDRVYERDVEVHSRRVHAEELLTEIEAVVEQEKKAADSLDEETTKLKKIQRHFGERDPTARAMEETVKEQQSAHESLCRRRDALVSSIEGLSTQAAATKWELGGAAPAREAEAAAEGAVSKAEAAAQEAMAAAEAASEGASLPDLRELSLIHI